MGRARHRITDRQWRRLFERQRGSGLSIAAFCEREGIAKSTFFDKRRNLAAKEGEANPSAAFVEVTPMDHNVAGEHVRDEVAEAAAARGDEPIELILRGSVVIRVRDGFDASLLRRVVDAIGGAA